MVIFLLLMLLAVAIAAHAEEHRSPQEPIAIEGDDWMDFYFKDQPGDGLSWETAYILEGLAIDQSGSDACIALSNTTRHIIIRDCLLAAKNSSGTEWGIRLDSIENVRIEECTIVDLLYGIYVLDSQDITINSSKISFISATGIIAGRVTSLNIHDTDIHNSDTAIIVDDSISVLISSIKVWSNNRGILVGGTEDSFIDQCHVWSNADVGISVENSQSYTVENNTVDLNLISGIQITGSRNGEVRGNEVFDNYRGITVYDSDQTNIKDNDVSFNDVLGIRLSSCTDITVTDNNIRSNWGRGIGLMNSDGNKIKDNIIYSHERGIVITNSHDNDIVSNKIIGNWWFGIDGDVESNNVRDNRMGANSWLRGLMALIVGLIILGVVVGIYFWAKRRRLSKVEKDQVLIRRRFPSGAKALWPMSKVMWDEDFFQAQLATAGPQKEDILRRYQQNIAAAKQMQYMAVGTMSVMLAFMAALPLIGVMNVATTDISADNVNDILFASSMSIGVYFLMSFMILLVFGLLFTSQLMKGEIFKLLSTLPMADKDARRVTVYMLLRMYGAPLIVVLLTFPVGGFIVTWSVGFLLTALLVNGLYLLFVTYVLILIADATSRKIFSASASKGATVMRFVIMGGYLMAMMFMFITLDILSNYITDLFITAKETGGSGVGINAGMSLAPFPYSGSYLISISLVKGSHVTATVILTTLAGFAMMVGVVYGIRKRVNGILARVARGVEHAAGGPGQLTTIGDINIITRRPRPAFMRNGLLVTSRDQGAIMYIIMPLIFPLIFILPGADRAGAGVYDAVLPFLFYMGIMPFLVNMALSTSDASVGGLLGSLPFRVLDHYRAKWMTIVMIVVVPVVAITVIMFNIAVEPAKMVALMASLVPLIMVMASVYLVTFSMAFGQVNGKYTLFMTKIRMKLAKYVGIIVLQYGLVILELAAFYILTEGDVISFWTGIVGLLVLNLSILIILEATARRLFD
jgi:parallel beta-helix repeat protein